MGRKDLNAGSDLCLFWMNPGDAQQPIVPRGNRDSERLSGTKIRPVYCFEMIVPQIRSRPCVLLGDLGRGPGPKSGHQLGDLPAAGLGGLDPLYAGPGGGRLRLGCRLDLRVV